MAWTATKVWSAAVLTSAEMQEQVSDNMDYLHDALGTMGQTSSSANKSLKSALCGVSASRGSDQTISDSTWTAINFTGEDFDTANGASSTFHTTGGSNERLTVPSGLDGYYQIEANVIWDTNTTGRRAVRILLNGTTHLALVRDNAVTGGATGTALNIVRLYSLAGGDYVEIDVYQDSGGNRTIDGTTFSALPFFQMYRVGV